MDEINEEEGFEALRKMERGKCALGVGENRGTGKP